MEWSTIVKNFMEIGVLGLSGCLIIYLSYLNFIKKNQKLDEKDNKNNELVNKDQDRLDSFLQASQQQNQTFQKHILDQMDLLTKNIINHGSSTEENEKITKVSAEIDRTLACMLEETGADRVALVQYHNGGKGINHQSFLKMSMTNEQVKLGVKPIIMDFKDQFRSVLGYFTKELIEKGCCYIDNVEDLKNVDNGMYEFMLTRGVSSKYGISINRIDSFPLGFICIEYNDIEKRNPEAVKKVFQERQKAIETLLTL